MRGSFWGTIVQTNMPSSVAASYSDGQGNHPAANPTSVVTTTSIAGGPSSSVLPALNNQSDSSAPNISQGRVLPVFQLLNNNSNSLHQNSSAGTVQASPMAKQMPSSPLMEPQSPISSVASLHGSYFEGVSTKLMRMNLTGGVSRYVRLNVGGRIFMTTVDTLVKHESMLSAMMSGRMDLVTDDEGWILIDRAGTHFELILNFLRDGNLEVSQLTDKELFAVLTEANFYSLDPLSQLIQQEQCYIELDDRSSSMCVNLSSRYVKLVPFICTNQMDESSLFKTGKASVKFLCNRQNNKYSYTSQSDENLLKNIELFDKLAVLYQGRLNFYKDIFGFSSNEICHWSFYSRGGHKRADVCCSSIVYSTEKKNIKIDFPESKVQEELIFLIADEGTPEPIHNDVIRAMRCKHSTNAMA